MNDALEKLFESQVLDDRTKEEIKEYIQNKLKETELKVRGEYAKVFEMDKAKLVEALDSFVNQNLQAEIDELRKENHLVKKTRAELVKEKIKLKEEYRKNLKRTIERFEGFLRECLREEIGELREDRKRYAALRKRVIENYRKRVKELREENRANLEKFSRFISEELSREVHEFKEDKKSLLEAKARFLKESKQQLSKAKRVFVKRAASLLESKIEDLLRKEIKQFRSDIDRIRENNFGRKIFEAFGQEFMNSYLAEGTKIKRALKKMKVLERRLNESEENARRAQALLESERARAQKAELLLERNRKLENLLKPLSGEKRKLMESMLEGVPLKNLENAFQRYLPVVMGNSNPGKKPIVVENRERGGKILVTGNKENILQENQDSRLTNDSNNEIIQLRRLAGLS